jgi:ABC-type phosphate transport system substrate-binding protein
MNRFILFLGLLALCAVATVPCAAQCTPGSLVVIVNKANPTDSLSMAQLRKLMLGDIKSWPDRKPVLLINREASSNAAKCILTAVVRMSDSEYRRYMMNAEFRGEEAVASKNSDSPATAARMVSDAPGAITVLESSALAGAGANTKVVRLNGKQPGEAGYPL